jgi:hypothetical protein
MREILTVKVYYMTSRRHARRWKIGHVRYRNVCRWLQRSFLVWWPHVTKYCTDKLLDNRTRGLGISASISDVVAAAAVDAELSVSARAAAATRLQTCQRVRRFCWSITANCLVTPRRAPCAITLRWVLNRSLRTRDKRKTIGFLALYIKPVAPPCGSVPHRAVWWAYFYESREEERIIQELGFHCLDRKNFKRI